MLGYRQYSYTTQDKVLQIGPLSATAERTHTVDLPPALGWLLVGGGVCLVVLAVIRRNG